MLIWLHAYKQIYVVATHPQYETTSDCWKWKTALLTHIFTASNQAWAEEIETPSVGAQEKYNLCDAGSVGGWELRLNWTALKAQMHNMRI